MNKFSRSSVFLVWVLSVTACTESTPPATTAPEEIITATSAGEAPVGQLDQSVVPQHYRIELKVDPRENTFSGSTEIDVQFIQPRDLVWMHGKNLQVSEAWITTANGERIEATFEQVLESGVARLKLSRPVSAGHSTLHFVYEAPFNTSANAMYKVVRGEESYAATQFQAIAARQVFPGFDEPAFKVPFDLELVTRADDVAITTTPEQSAEILGDGFVHRKFETTRPLPTYLLAFAIGPFDVLDIGNVPANSIRSRELPLRGLAARGQGERMNYALEHTSGLLTALEEYFGTPYPYRKLDLIAVPEGFGGAMENVGAITYNEWLMLMDEESSLNQRRAYAVVHAHEMAHMWFGNLVTPDWWTDIWLNESFASWMMYKAADTYWPEGEFDLSVLKSSLRAMDNDSLAAAREIREPIHNNDRISSAFDSITYQKGAGVLAMLERYVGEENFQKGIQLHMQRYADSTANADSFINSVAEGSGASEIEAAFRSFIDQPGVPLLTADVVCEQGQPPRLEVSQSRYAPLGSSIDAQSSEWLVPMCVSYDADGERKSTCAMLRESKQTLELDAETCPGMLHPNADGAGYYRFTMKPTWLEGLIAGASSLTASEALVLADSLDASFLAGETSAASYLAGMAELVNHPDWNVAEMAMENLDNSLRILDAGQLESVLPSLQKIVKPRYQQLAGANDEGSKILRQRMQGFLIVVAMDRQMREPLIAKAAARIGLNREADPRAIPVDEMETTLTAGVQELGEPFFELLLEQGLASEDPAFRNAAFGALARTEDPVLAASLHAAVLAGKFKGSESRFVIVRQLARQATTEQTFRWFRENDEKLINMVPESFRSSDVPSIGGVFCDAGQADDWQTLIKSRAELIPGYERDLAQAVESTRLCAGLKQAQGRALFDALVNFE